MTIWSLESRLTVLSTSFEHECAAAIDAVRASLIELYASVGADPAGPQDVSRRFGINKTLAWNIAKVMTGHDPLASIPNLPGTQAFELLLHAFERGGADATALARARGAIEQLEKTVERHAGDRTTLGLIVDGITPGRGDHLAQSRKLAFRGNSGLLGIQSSTRLMTVFMVPNADDPGRIDIAIVRGYIGLRRLRADVRWPIFQVRGWGHVPGMATDEGWAPLDGPPPGAPGVPLLQRFSTIGDDDIEIERTEAGCNYLLKPGPIGNVGAVDCFISDASRAAVPAHRVGLDETGEFGATISAPTERLIFDLIVDERLEFVLDCTVHATLGLFTVQLPHTLPVGELPLQVPQRVENLPGCPPVVATPRVPRYPEIVRHVRDRMGWESTVLRGCRYELSHPPLGSTILLRFALPDPPAAADAGST